MPTPPYLGELIFRWVMGHFLAVLYHTRPNVTELYNIVPVEYPVPWSILRRLGVTFETTGKSIHFFGPATPVDSYYYQTPVVLDGQRLQPCLSAGWSWWRSYCCTSAVQWRYLKKCFRHLFIEHISKNNRLKKANIPSILITETKTCSLIK